MKRPLMPLMPLLFVLACGEKDDSDTAAAADRDGDGSPAAEDCDDGNASKFPGNDELCDDQDNDCDGAVDEAPSDGTTWYADDDLDDWGVDAETAVACDRPPGYAEQAGDCDDSDADIHPGAAETDCSDPTDYNCDGSVGYTDADGDGHAACAECDDSDAAVNPDADEVCDGEDNDCDGGVDLDAVDATTFNLDADGDGYGNPDYEVQACEGVVGWVENDDDCDDLHAEVHPGGTEVCDGLDNDCSGGPQPEELDDDGDGFVECVLNHWQGPAIDGGEDCDDADAAVNPDAEELCDDQDNDCDGVTDEDDAADASTWYIDYDGDDFGSSAYTTEACDQPSGYASADDDCDDTDGDINPDAAEVCDGEDNDCSGDVDDNAVDATTWYLDDDGDGFGDPLSSVEDCDQPSDYVLDSSDCDDTDADVNTDADEVCDGADNNCDGTVDESTAIDASTWYEDGDGDGYGDANSSVQACSQPSGYVANGDDCDDGDSNIGECACEIASVTGPTHHVSRGNTHGAWVPDPAETLGPGIVWDMNGYSNQTQVVQYASVAAMVSGNATRTISLSNGWEGTGGAVYDGHLYYAGYNSNTLYEVDLSTNTVVSTYSLSGAGYHNTYAYGWGGYSDIDFAVDEQGLWVIYATSANSGRVVVSKLDTQPLAVTGTWNTNSQTKTSMGNAFMVCGVLYTTYRYNGSSTTINYWFDTSDSSDGSLSIPFSQPGGYLTQISYNPTDQLLYVWNNSRHETYSVTFQ